MDPENLEQANAFSNWILPDGLELQASLDEEENAARHPLGDFTPRGGRVRFLDDLAVPPLLRPIRSNPFRAISALRELHRAEESLLNNDLDGNGIRNDWAVNGATLSKWGLIEESIAGADSRPLISVLPRPITRSGSLFSALEQDNGASTPESQARETDKKSRAVHNLERSGFTAYSADGIVAANPMAVVDQNNTIFYSPAIPVVWPGDNEWVSHGSKGCQR